MSSHEHSSSDRSDSEEERVTEKSETTRRVSYTRTVPSTYETIGERTYTRRTEATRVYESERGTNTSEAVRSSVGSSSIYETTPTATAASEPVVFTRTSAETERYLSMQGIDLCKNPNIIRRTINDKPLDYEQRVCVRYLQPPPLPAPGPLTIEELRKPTLPPPPLVIREQPTVVETPPPIIIREKPPTRPIIPGPETKTVVVPCDTAPERSVIIERYPAVQERPPNIVIERWLPYGPLPEREVIVKKYGCNAEYEKPTCTIVNYDGPNARVTRKFGIVDVQNADPDDYVARHGGSLLDSDELIHAVRRVGIIEDITSPSSLSVRVYTDRKTVDYRTSKEPGFEWFSSGAGATVVTTNLTGDLGNVSTNIGEGVTRTTTYEHRTEQVITDS